ncbi:hypothetical protein V493_07676, partial [Pseudogymnoascus sp. VKM F-4281 (FW-2241)]
MEVQGGKEGDDDNGADFAEAGGDTVAGCAVARWEELGGDDEDSHPKISRVGPTGNQLWDDVVAAGGPEARDGARAVDAEAVEGQVEEEP